MLITIRIRASAAVNYLKLQFEKACIDVGQHSYILVKLYISDLSQF